MLVQIMWVTPMIAPILATAFAFSSHCIRASELDYVAHEFLGRPLCCYLWSTGSLEAIEYKTLQETKQLQMILASQSQFQQAPYSECMLTVERFHSTGKLHSYVNFQEKAIQQKNYNSEVKLVRPSLQIFLTSGVAKRESELFLKRTFRYDTLVISKMESWLKVSKWCAGQPIYDQRGLRISLTKEKYLTLFEDCPDFFAGRTVKARN